MITINQYETTRILVRHWVNLNQMNFFLVYLEKKYHQTGRLLHIQYKLEQHNFTQHMVEDYPDKRKDSSSGGRSGERGSNKNRGEGGNLRKG